MKVYEILSQLENCPAGADVIVSQPSLSDVPGELTHKDIKLVDTSESLTEGVVYLDIDR